MTKTKTETVSEKQNKKSFLNLKNFNKFLFTLIIISGLYHLVSINDLVVKGFSLQELKQEIQLLNAANKEIDLKIMTLGSYNELSQRAVDNLNMVAVGDMDYVTAINGVVVKK